MSGRIPKEYCEGEFFKINGIDRKIIGSHFISEEGTETLLIRIEGLKYSIDPWDYINDEVYRKRIDDKLKEEDILKENGCKFY